MFLSNFVKTSGSIHLFKLTGSINKEKYKTTSEYIMGYNGNRLETGYSNIKWECN